MDRYNQKWVHIVGHIAGAGKEDFAITLGQTTYFTCPENMVSPSWHRHEDTHKEQWAQEGAAMFTLKYLWYSLRCGYKQNPFEVMARVAEKETTS
jgi:hypothetical protein